MESNQYCTCKTNSVVQQVITIHIAIDQNNHLFFIPTHIKLATTVYSGDFLRLNFQVYSYITEILSTSKFNSDK